MYWRSNESDLWLEYEREEQSEDDEMSERNEMIAESVNLSCDQNTNLNVDQVVLDDALELKMCYCWRESEYCCSFSSASINLVFIELKMIILY